MGVEKLAPLLEPLTIATTLAVALSNDVFGVDVSCPVHILLAAHAEAVLGGSWSQFDKDFEWKLRAYKALSDTSTPIFFADGHRVAAKTANGTRRAQRESAAQALQGVDEQIDQLRDQLGSSQATEDTSALREIVDERAELSAQLVGALKSRRTKARTAAAALAPEAIVRVRALCVRSGLEFVVATGEAEHEMRAWLDRGDNRCGRL